MNELAFQRLLARMRGSKAGEDHAPAEPSQSRTAEAPASLPGKGDAVLSHPTASAFDPALLEAEEALFRLWWRTLPDKALARSRWADHVEYYGQSRGLSNALITALMTRAQDLSAE